jgi:hypothetical protein
MAIFQYSTKFQDVFSIKKVIFVNIWTLFSCGCEVYSAYNTFSELKYGEEFSYPSIHSVLSNLTIYIFYMGMTLRLGVFSEF